VDDQQLGAIARAVRRARRMRQMDVAAAAGISQVTVSRFERGHLSALSLQTIRAILTVLEIRLSQAPTWRGSGLERLLDEDHATLVAAVTRILEGRGWTVLVEVTYSRYGERGSIDVLAVRRDIRAILVVEVKTELVSVEQVIRRLDAKVRLAPHIAAERLGWRPAAVGRLLVLPESTTERRRWARHSVVLARSFPVSGGRAVREWLGRPPTASRQSGFFHPVIAGLQGECDASARRSSGPRHARMNVTAAWNPLSERPESCIESASD
jgi:transcriptional regulator with XRE-family HTH domain